MAAQKINLTEEEMLHYKESKENTLTMLLGVIVRWKLKSATIKIRCNCEPGR